MPAVNLSNSNIVLVTSFLTKTPLTRVEFVTRNQRKIGFQFFDENGLRELAGGSTGQILVKKSGQHSLPALARATSWTKEGTGASAIYWFRLNLMTDDLDTAFSTAGIETLTNLVFELTFEEDGDTKTAPRVPCTIWNRYLQSDEGVPVETFDYPLPQALLLKTAQTLSGPEKAQVRTNIGVPSLEDLAEASAIADAAIPAAEKAQAEGVATLDAGGKVPISQLPDSVVGQIEYQGGWDAATNTPAIPAAGAGNKGHYYVVTVTGTSDPDGAGRTWEPGDWLVSSGATWDKIDNTEPVATEVLAGISRRATPAEAVGGAETAAHLTPATLTEVDRAYRSRINLLLCGY